MWAVKFSRLLEDKSKELRPVVLSLSNIKVQTHRPVQYWHYSFVQISIQVTVFIQKNEAGFII